jgi:hypothetical protein
MSEAAVAASAAMVASAVVGKAVDVATLLGWCFSMGSLTFGVFGFIYGIYASARLSDKEHLEIVGFLVSFCTALMVVLGIETALAVYLAIVEKVRWEAFALVLCLLIIFFYVFRLTMKMYTPGRRA